MSFGQSRIFGSIHAAEQSALTADSDCSQGEAALYAVARCGGGFCVNPIRQQIKRAADNLGLMPTPKLDEAYMILDGMTPEQVAAIFTEVRRTINLRRPKKRR